MDSVLKAIQKENLGFCHFEKEGVGRRLRPSFAQGFRLRALRPDKPEDRQEPFDGLMTGHDPARRDLCIRRADLPGSHPEAGPLFT